MTLVRRPQHRVDDLPSVTESQAQPDAVCSNNGAKLDGMQDVLEFIETNCRQPSFHLGEPCQVRHEEFDRCSVAVH